MFRMSASTRLQSENGGTRDRIEKPAHRSRRSRNRWSPDIARGFSRLRRRARCPRGDGCAPCLELCVGSHLWCYAKLPRREEGRRSHGQFGKLSRWPGKTRDRCARFLFRPVAFYGCSRPPVPTCVRAVVCPPRVAPHRDPRVARASAPDPPKEARAARSTRTKEEWATR